MKGGLLDPCQLFLRVHEGFAQRGLLGRALRLAHEGRTYSVRCDRDCFTVYRVNDKPFIPPGLPGWTVCRLTRQDCFGHRDQGPSCPLPAEDDYAEAAGLWVEMALDWLARQPPADEKEKA